VVAPPWRLGSAPAIPAGVPRLGEHTRVVLAEHGVAAVEVERLLHKGVVAQAPPQTPAAAGGSP
jgi:crotonobetainyl-CoA:carnitine CoA-transferase CaiB-like acyl-CoA transferase